MARRISLEPHLTIDELEARYRSTTDSVERSRWHFLWLLARGLTAKLVASITGYSAYWIGRIARRYNEQGPIGVKDLRHQTRPSIPLLSASQQGALVAALTIGSAPEGIAGVGGRSPPGSASVSVDALVASSAGPTCDASGHDCGRPAHAMCRLTRRPKPTSNSVCLRPLLRAVATAFPQATVELWAVDERRIGLKPILRTVWTLLTFPGQRPLAPVEHRYAWRYLVGFVHPASGRTIWHLATTVNIDLFSVELEAFAQQVGAGPTKQIVLVLDGAGWHDSPRVRVPEHVHLLFLPPHSPELQPAEHLWPLTNTVLVNQHFASIEELEDAQAQRCIALQARPDLIRSTTLFHWWPQRITKRQGPRSR